MFNLENHDEYKKKRHTWNEMESLVARASISAQETTPGHSCSSLVLTSSITSKLPRDRFGGAVFSDVLLSLSVGSSNTDASQPYNIIRVASLAFEDQVIINSYNIYRIFQWPERFVTPCRPSL